MYVFVYLTSIDSFYEKCRMCRPNVCRNIDKQKDKCACDTTDNAMYTDVDIWTIPHNN